VRADKAFSISMEMIGFIYRWGLILQAVAIVHFVQRRPAADRAPARVVDAQVLSGSQQPRAGGLRLDIAASLPHPHQRLLGDVAD